MAYQLTLNMFSTFFVLFLSFACIPALDHRTKRYLTVVNRHSPIVQLIAAVGIPVNLELEAVTMGFALKVDFQLPANATDFTGFFSDPFDVQTHTFGRRSVNEERDFLAGDYVEQQQDEFQRHSKDLNTVENANNMNGIGNNERVNNFASTRWLVYKALARVAENYGLAGRSCVLRTICEAAHTPFDYSNGILGELFHIVMSPSETNDDIFYHEDNEYLHAESLGKEGAPCEHVFNECEVSLLEKFTGTY